MKTNVEIDGFKLQCIIEGSGIQALVVGSSLYYSRVFSQNLRNYFRFIFMDHRGFVPAPGPVDNTAFALDVLINDIELVRQALGLERFIIIGHSGHGYIALEYAKKYPEHVSHVVLIGLGPDQSAESHKAAEQYWQESVWPERKAFLEEQMRYLPKEIQAHPDQRFITYMLKTGARSWYNFRFDATPLWAGIYTNLQMFDYVWGVIFRDIDITQGLENFDKPVFLGLGRYDYLVAPAYTWNPLRSKFQNLTVRVFEHSGHTPNYEEQELFDTELVHWLSRYPDVISGI